MKKTHIKNTGRWLLMVLAALMLTACAGTGVKKSHGPVVDRAEARWDAIFSEDFEAAYGFYSPGYRSSTSQADFVLSLRLRKVQFTEAEFRDQSCTENACTLDFSMSYTIASPVPGVDTWNGDQIVSERWIRTEGEWWYLPDN